MIAETIEELFATDCQHPSHRVEEWRARRDKKPITCRGCDLEVVPVYWLRPEWGGSWLIVQDVDLIEEYMRPGESEDVWELRRAYMTPDEIEALPEHEGW